jgi:lipopolysaccharide export LptBFGC system permease protein LptF
MGVNRMRLGVPAMRAGVPTAIVGVTIVSLQSAWSRNRIRGTVQQEDQRVDGC